MTTSEFVLCTKGRWGDGVEVAVGSRKSGAWIRTLTVQRTQGGKRFLTS